MLSIAEAQAIVLQHAQPLPAETVPLTAHLLGRVLAEDVFSDVDMPPFDKALMDGYAVQAPDLAERSAILQVVGEVSAGQVPGTGVKVGEAVRIMTGAPIPSGANSVVMIERTNALEGNRVRIDYGTCVPGQNILRQGQEMRRGDKVLESSTVLRPQEFGVLATVGRATVAAIRAPRVGVLSTGDELVEAAETPGPGQIRNGNGPMLVAQVARAGGIPHYLPIARDTRADLAAKMTAGLVADVLVLSGGVSAGKRDLVPDVLKELGVVAHFHKVAMKPGKPVFFGTKETTLVFGLPGNPVSAMVCFELFVRPAMRKLSGHADPGSRLIEARSSEDFAYRSDRPTYHPARLKLTPEGWMVSAVPWFGSPDLRGLMQSNAFVVLPVGDNRFQKGQLLSVMMVEG